MAITKAPLFGLDASGALAKSIVFSKWRGRTYVRRHTVPANPRSGLQVGIRSVMKFVSQDFTNLTQAQKDSWDTLAAPDNITQLNAQVRLSITRARRNLGWVQDQTTTALTTIDAPTTLTATAAPKAVDLSWTRPGANLGNYSVGIWMSLTGIFIRDISVLKAIQTVTDTTITIVGLTTGVEVFFEVAETGARGLLGSPSGEASATPT